MDSRLTKLEMDVQAKSPAYFAAVEADRLADEQELEAEAAKAALERSAGGDDDDEAREDKIHADTRRLKFAERFRLVTKNKDEGAELFKDGNFAHAAKRFKDALGHAAKFFDLSPENAASATKSKVDLYLNLALCWAKMDNSAEVVKCCDEALRLDESSAKALYRRAAALEKTNKFDEAKLDLKKALKLVPEDKAVLALDKRVDAQIARAKAAEKKMWSKAFN